MILRALFLTIFFTLSLMSESLNFSEQRYSDALGRYISFSGEITFEEESLHIKYTKSNREILYKDSMLTLKQNGNVVELDEVESSRIAQYFEILLLLHSEDEEALKEKFEVEKKDDISLLFPKGYTANFLEKIELKKQNKKLKMVKLFLKNLDHITISIEDEVR